MKNALNYLNFMTEVGYHIICGIIEWGVFLGFICIYKCRTPNPPHYSFYFCIFEFQSLFLWISTYLQIKKSSSLFKDQLVLHVCAIQAIMCWVLRNGKHKNNKVDYYSVSNNQRLCFLPIVIKILYLLWMLSIIEYWNSFNLYTT